MADGGRRAKKTRRRKHLLGAREEGGMTILLALLLPILLALFLLILETGRKRLDEVDFARAMAAAAEEALAMYSRAFWRDFGLWATPSGDVALEASRRLLPKNRECELNATGKDDIFAAEKLAEAIHDHMKLRAPIMLGVNFMRRWKNIGLGRRALGYSSTELALRHVNEELEAEKAEKSLAEVRLSTMLEGQTSGNSIAEGAEDADFGMQESSEAPEVFEDFFTIADTPAQEASGREEEEGLRLPVFIEKILRSFMRGILPVYEAAGSQATEESSFSPRLFEELAAQLDRFLDAGMIAETRKLCLAEYVLSYFPAAVHLERRPEGLISLATPDGRQHRNLAGTRQAEAEQLAVGILTAEEAEKKTEHLLQGMRFVVQFIAGSCDSRRSAIYEGWGNGLSVTVATISLGQVVIPASALRYALQAADSFRLALLDVRRLGKGDGLPFWPISTQKLALGQFLEMDFYYRDYLRLILLLRSEDSLLSDLAVLMKRHCPEVGWTAFRIRGSFEGREAELDCSYRTSPVKEKDRP